MKTDAFIIIAFLMLFAAPQSHARYFESGDEYVEPDNATFRPSIIKFDDKTTLDSLSDKGAVILRKRGNLALAYLPLQREVVSTPESRKAPVRRRPGNRLRNVPAMDLAREKYDAWRVTEGTSATPPFTGKGVVVGLCDIGFDPMHPNFLGSDGNTRIRRIVQYKESSGERIVMDSPSQFLEWRTDNENENHATHVAGIMAGSYSANGYQGVAADADIVATTSQLSDVGLLAGAEDIIEYAKSVGKPAVINLSMGQYNGPHDGSSLFCQYMDMLGEEAVICLSAGNEGKKNNNLSFDFSQEKSSVGARLANTRFNQFNMYGMIDCWSADYRELTIRPVVYDEYTHTIVHSLPYGKLTDGETIAIVTSSDFIDSDIAPLSPVTDTDLAGYYSGYMIMTGGVSEENGRFYVKMEYDLETDILSPAGKWARYNIAFFVDAAPGVHADIYADGQYTFLKQMPDEPAPGSYATFSDLACGENVMSVGMYYNRPSYPLLDGSSVETNQEPSTISPDSSYGTLLDGSVRPLTVAPGYLIISSMSGPYIEAHPEEAAGCSAKADADGRDAYWVINGGTSMSCPYVAGYIATWLEADPDLDINQIKEIVAATNRHDYPDADNPRHGQGWFDPYAGLLKVIEQSGTDEIISGSRLKITFGNADGHLTVWNPAGKEIEWSACSADGTKVAYGREAGERIALDLSSLRTGVYFVTATTSGSAKSSFRFMKK